LLPSTSPTPAIKTRDELRVEGLTCMASQMLRSISVWQRWIKSQAVVIWLKPLAEPVVRPAGIEPATPAFGGQYSIH
jgi:hypothetical protein